MSTNSNPEPKFTDEQLRFLEKQFPHQVIDPSIGLADVMYRAGQTAVVEWVRSKVGFSPRTQHRDR